MIELFARRLAGGKIVYRCICGKTHSFQPDITDDGPYQIALPCSGTPAQVTVVPSSTWERVDREGKRG